MNKGHLIKQAEKFAKKILSGEGMGHDWWHIERVRANAKLINKAEKADPFVVDLALLLHDVGDYKIVGKDKDDYTVAERFLRRQKVPADVTDQVMFIVKNISFRKSNGGKKIKATKEFYVAQDADRLDAIGAIGIARAFAYGGKLGRPLYDPTKQSSSTFDHFEEKLFRVKKLMNTKAAKKITAKRHAFLRQYYHHFLAEWDGRK